MKLTTIIYFTCLMQVSATVYSQATKFAFTAENKKVSEVLKEIEDNSNFRFFYQNEQVDVNRRVTVKANDATVEQILDKIFKGEEISYKVLEDDLILLSPEKKAFETVGEKIAVSQQQGIVTGKVTDTGGDLTRCNNSYKRDYQGYSYQCRWGVHPSPIFPKMPHWCFVCWDADTGGGGWKSNYY